MNDEYICDDRNYGISEKYKNMTEEEIEEERKEQKKNPRKVTRMIMPSFGFKHPEKSRCFFIPKIEVRQ